MHSRKRRSAVLLRVLILLSSLAAASVHADELTRLIRNDAVELTVSSFRMADHYGPLQPAGGRKFLVLSTEWRNLLGTTMIDGKLMPTPYVVPVLDQQLFLVVNGGKIAALAPTEGRPGTLPNKNFKVADPAASVRGNLVFDVSADARDLLLLFADEQYGVMSAQLAGASTAVPARTEKNEVVEAFVANQRVIEDASASAVTQTIAVDVRLRSAFNPDRKAKTSKLVKLPDWQEKYVQATADGTYLGTLVSGPYDSTATILPEVFVGGEFVFRVPAKRTALNLNLYFGELATPTGKVRPRTISLPIKLPAEPYAEARQSRIASARDGVFDIGIVDVSTVDQFGGVKAAEGKRFLVVDAVVANVTAKPESFQTVDQLQHVGADGKASSADDATFQGPHPPLKLIYLPGGEKRSFQLAYLIPNDETKTRLTYAAVTEGGSKTLDLPALPATASAPVTNGATPTTPPVAMNTAPASSPEASSNTVVKPETVMPSRPTPARPTTTPAPVAAQQDLRPRGLAGVGVTPEQVNSAIDRGAKALWENIRDSDLKGSTFGYWPAHSLAALALVHADAHKKIPEFNVVLREYLSAVEPRKLGVYRAGLTAMLIEAYGDATFTPKLEEATRYLLEGQGQKGTWIYTPPVPESIFVKPSEAPSVLQVSGGVPLDKATEPWKRIAPFTPETDGDNSVTQYALLGLNAASRTGVKVAPAVWESALATTRERQNDNGGWGYNGRGSNSYGSMTAAGICAVALCRHELGEVDPAKDPSIERGLEWLDANFSVVKHPASDKWLYYYLYSLERVGRVLDTEFIGSHEWYPLGAKQLLVNQKGSGLWIDEGEEKDPRLASSFALLFLTRATPSLNIKREQGPGTLEATASAPFQKYYIILDASGSMLEEMDGRPKFDIARDAVRSLVNELPPNCMVALRVYGHRKRAVEPNSDEDTELKIPMSPIDKAKFSATLDTLRSRGKTPLALSVEMAMKDIGRVEPGKPVTLLLLTDGGEDTTRPRRDPVKAAAALAEQKDIRFHIVGFDINQPDWSEQLQAMATVSGGRYWPAAKAADLQRGVRAAVLGVPEQYVLFDADGHEVARNAFGIPAKLPAGKYRFQTAYAGQTFEREIWLNPGSITSVRFDAAQAPAGAPAPQNATAPAMPVAPQPSIQSSPKFCTHCGASLQPGAKFCGKCGTPVPQ